MKGAQVIAAYEQVLEIMRSMHEAASGARWDELVELERRCRRVVDGIAAGESAPLANVEAQRKAAIIRQLLALDAAIRDMTQPWLAQLQGFLGSRGRERKLQQAYGAPDGA
jgi:flagellar protein FliT